MPRFAVPPLGSEIIGQTTNEFGVKIQVMRTPHGDISLIPHSHPADAFTNPAMWERVAGAPETKRNRAMMGASEMRRYLKGRKDL